MSAVLNMEPNKFLAQLVTWEKKQEPLSKHQCREDEKRKWAMSPLISVAHNLQVCRERGHEVAQGAVSLIIYVRQQRLCGCQLEVVSDFITRETSLVSDYCSRKRRAP